MKLYERRTSHPKFFIIPEEFPDKTRAAKEHQHNRHRQAIHPMVILFLTPQDNHNNQQRGDCFQRLRRETNFSGTGVNQSPPGPVRNRISMAAADENASPMRNTVDDAGGRSKQIAGLLPLKLQDLCRRDCKQWHVDKASYNVVSAKDTRFDPVLNKHPQDDRRINDQNQQNRSDRADPKVLSSPQEEEKYGNKSQYEKGIIHKLGVVIH